MSKALVAYFSATETTRGLAERLADAIGADLFRIKPKQEYTEQDLDWTKKTSRSSIEMADKNTRPAIASKVKDISEYDVIFLGFPIWWYREPSIIDTFIESYDLAGATIVPFATSGGSGIGVADENIRKLLPMAKIEKGKRFSTSVSDAELKKWAEKYI